MSNNLHHRGHKTCSIYCEPVTERTHNTVITMAHKIIFKPTFILNLKQQFTTTTTSQTHNISHCHFLHHPFFNIKIRPISLHSTTPITTTAAATANHGGYLDLTDDDLMRQCEMGTFKTSGPGGQHRNKRESAVRLKHLPTGIIAQVFLFIIINIFLIF